MEGNKKLFSGQVAFTLYDTYGFPLDLTQDILRAKGIQVNVAEFEQAMEEQRERSKWSGTGDIKNNEVYYKIKERIKETNFVGYDNSVATGQILALVKNNNEVNEVKTGDEFEFFVDKTSFYGEMGGQCGDSGIGMKIETDGKIQLPFTTIEISDVKQPFEKYYLHKAKVESGIIKVGDHINLAINTARRDRIKANHSATHLLEFALRKLFGENVIQKGSAISESGARFDFSLNKAISGEQIREIENIVNALIFKNTDTLTKIMPLEEAKNTGAIALFGEKYGEMVRVVFIGEREKEQFKAENVADGLHFLNNSSLQKYCSVDFCGGTHIKKTGEIGLFKIKSESSIGSGIRRIEILTGKEALQFLNEYQKVAENVATLLECSELDIAKKVQKMDEEFKIVKKELDTIKKRNLLSIEFSENKVNNITLATIKLDADPKDLKGVFIDKQNKKYNNNTIMLALTTFENKNTIMLGVSKDLNSKYKANNLIKEIGQGGGQDWFATGSCINNDINAMIDKIKSILL